MESLGISPTRESIAPVRCFDVPKNLAMPRKFNALVRHRKFQVFFSSSGSLAMLTAILCASSRGKAQPSVPSLLRGLFCFVTNIAEFWRAFDEPALSSCSFCASCSLIAKAIDFSARHLGCFAFGTLAELPGGGLVSETALD